MTDKPTCRTISYVSIRDWIAIQIFMRGFYLTASTEMREAVCGILVSELTAWKQRGEHPQFNKDESK